MTAISNSRSGAQADRPKTRGRMQGDSRSGAASGGTSAVAQGLPDKIQVTKIVSEDGKLVIVEYTRPRKAA